MFKVHCRCQGIHSKVLYWNVNKSNAETMEMYLCLVKLTYSYKDAKNRDIGVHLFCSNMKLTFIFQICFKNVCSFS